jgi:hypothetical protein
VPVTSTNRLGVLLAASAASAALVLAGGGSVATGADPPPARVAPAPAGQAPAEIAVRQTDEAVEIETDAIAAAVRKRGYVSGVAERSFLDKRTGARDVGFGLHIMDFLMAPGWREDGYLRDPKVHGDLPKHYVEGPQVCTQAKQLPVEVVRGDGFVAVKMRYTFHEPGQGYKAGSTWEQTLVFQPGVRYVVSSEAVTSANDADNVFYRIDMPGHIKHGGAEGDTFAQVYLSYAAGGGGGGDDDGRGQLIPAAEFAQPFGPDALFLYQRQDRQVPQRMIRAYQVKHDGKPGPWLAGMTLDPAAVSEAWCHERGYVCFIQELHGRKVRAGETFGAAYVVGWFDDVAEMHAVYDRHKGAAAVIIDGGTFRLAPAVPQDEARD